MRKIVLTGGGTAGHVTPNLALIPKLKEKGWDIHYIGSKSGIEKTLIDDTGIPYYAISSGKLRRYFDVKNFKDPFNVLAGIAQSYKLIRKISPDVIFSKGGFVSVPVVIAAWLNKIPVLIHESDYTPGLANKISARFASKVFVTFAEAKQFLPADKVMYTGAPIREDILTGSRNKGLEILGFKSDKPIITVIGGSLGSVRLNTVIRNNLPQLLQNYQLVHICGQGNVDESFLNIEGYRQFEYIRDELADILAATDLIVSRAGSNSIYEWLALRKPMLLIPLSKNVSRGDQILNAESFAKQGFAVTLAEENLSGETFLNAVTRLHKNRLTYIDKMRKEAPKNSLELILQEIERVL